MPGERIVHEGGAKLTSANTFSVQLPGSGPYFYFQHCLSRRAQDKQFAYTSRMLDRVALKQPR